VGGGPGSIQEEEVAQAADRLDQRELHGALPAEGLAPDDAHEARRVQHGEQGDGDDADHRGLADAERACRRGGGRGVGLGRGAGQKWKRMNGAARTGPRASMPTRGRARTTPGGGGVRREKPARLHSPTQRGENWATSIPTTTATSSAVGAGKRSVRS